MTQNYSKYVLSGDWNWSNSATAQSQRTDWRGGVCSYRSFLIWLVVLWLLWQKKKQAELVEQELT